jgi:hypothetical protein
MCSIVGLLEQSGDLKHVVLANQVVVAPRNAVKPEGCTIERLLPSLPSVVAIILEMEASV